MTIGEMMDMSKAEGEQIQAYFRIMLGEKIKYLRFHEVHFLRWEIMLL